MTLEDIKEIAETWFEWPNERREYVTYTSTILFARAMYERGQDAEQKKSAKLIEKAEEVIAAWDHRFGPALLGTYVEALRDAVEKVKESKK